MSRRKYEDGDLQLQGSKVPSARQAAGLAWGAGLDHGDFNAYDIGLFCEGSSSSSDSHVSVLQPVPSLPGLTEPTGSSGTVKLTKQQGPAQGSSSSNLSPTKHQAWRRGNAPRPAGADAGNLLQSLPAAGRLTQAAQHSSSSSAVKAAAGKVAAGVQQHHGLKLPGVSSKAGAAGQSGSLGAKGIQAPKSMAGRKLAGEESAYDGPEHLTMIQVPEGVVTGVDAVRFVCSGAGKPGDLIYCNLAQRNPRRSSCAGSTDTARAPAAYRPVQERGSQPGAQHSSAAGAASTTAAVAAAAAAAAAGAVADRESGFYGDGYNPYDLRAVPQQQANKQQHWVVSYHGVTHMRAGEPPDLSPHAEWLRQSELFAVLKGLAFFKQWRIRSAFSSWRHVTVRLCFQRHAEALEASLLYKHPAVRAALQEAHWLCLHLSAAAVPKPRPKAPEVQPLQRFQTAVAKVAAAQALHIPAPPAAGSAVKGDPVKPASRSSCTNGSAQLQPQLSSSVSEPVWQRSGTYGQWRLVQQSSGLQGAAATAAEADSSGRGLPDARTSPKAASKGISVAGAAALVDELAYAAKRLLPQLQSKPCASGADPVQAVTATTSSTVGSLGAGAPGVQDQIQAAFAHSAKLLRLLCGVLQPEAVVLVSELLAWKESAQAATAKTMASLYTRLQDCLVKLQQQLAAELANKQAVAAAEQQAVYEAGKKPPLPWMVPVPFNLSKEQQDTRALLNRAAHCVNVLVTSHAAQLAAAATAHLLSSLVGPVDPVGAQQLCTQQQLPRLHSSSSFGGPQQGVRLRMHASLTERPPQEPAEGLDGSGTGQTEAPGTLRFDPSCEELVTVCGSIPTFVAAAAASLELLPVMAPKVGSNYSGSNSGSGGSSANGSNTGAGQQAPWHTCSRLPSGWARNVRLETVMTSCRSTEVQATVYDVLEEQYHHTMSNSFMQPYMQAPEMLDFCRTLDPQSYLAANPTSRQLAADIDSLGSWLAQLSSSGHHINVMYMKSVAAGANQDTAGRALQAAGSCSYSMSGISSSCLNSAGSGRRSAQGLLDIDVTILRPVLIEAGKSGLGLLLSALPLAFTQCSNRLHTQLDAAIATASQRPDSLQSYIDWQVAMQSHAQPQATIARSQTAGAHIAVGGSSMQQGLDTESAAVQGHAIQGFGQTGPMVVSRGSFVGGDAVRAGLLMDVEALRMLLDVLRPSASSGSCPEWLTSSHSSNSSQTCTGFRNEARQAVLHAVRQLGPEPARLADAALEGLQALVMTYKDAVKAAATHSALIAKKLAPQMAQLINQDSQQLEGLSVKLSADLAKQQHNAAAALLDIQFLQVEQQELLQSHAAHLQAAASFPTAQVTQALAAHSSALKSLRSALKWLSDFRTAQQAWDSQLELLYSTPADSPAGKLRLQELQAAGHALLEAAKSLQALYASKAASSSSFAGSDPLPAPLPAQDASAVSQLCGTVCMEVSAWEQRMPAAAQLMDASMQPKHVLMLLTVMHLAEGDSLDTVPDDLRFTAQMQQQARASDAAAYAHELQQALLHYGFLRQDGYTDVFLRNSAANSGTAFSATDRAGWQTPAAAANAAAACSAGSSSLAALLVWLTRNAATASFLSRVLDIARQELELSEQVAKVKERLQGVSLAISTIRVARVFVGDFAAVQQELQSTQKLLAAIQQSPCRHGVLSHLQAEVKQQEKMLAAAQACQSCQEQLLRLHNMCNHPALAGCLSDRHHAAAATAVKPWAGALLKLHCMTIGFSISTSGSSGNNSGSGQATAGTPESQGSVGAAGLVLQQHSWADCMDNLKAAAQESLRRIQLVRADVAAAILPAVHQRWPQLSLVPDAALLQLLEELPALFRAAWALQQQRQQQGTRTCAKLNAAGRQLEGQPQCQVYLQLPQLLLNALFRGVNAVLPAAVPQEALAHSDAGSSGSARDRPFSPAEHNSKHRKHIGLVAGTGTLSGCPWEPLTAAELAAGVGTMHITALLSLGDCTSNFSGSSSSRSDGLTCLSTPVSGTMLQQLALSTAGHSTAQKGGQQQNGGHRNSQIKQQPTAGTDQVPALAASAASKATGGVVWSIDSCPYAALHALHEKASQALRRELASALESASKLPVEQWATAPAQVLLLADAVMWTKAASGALQQLAAGNSRALRALYDAASLRLETVSAVLRGQRVSSKLNASCHAADCNGGGGGQKGTQGGSGAADKPPSRPGTPDTSDEVSKVSPRGLSAVTSSMKPGNGSSRSQRSNSSSSSGSGSGSARPAPRTSEVIHLPDTAGSIQGCRSVRQQLSQRQILGLQALASAAACHRDAASGLVAADIEGPQACEWITQLRHYWDPDTNNLKVCFGPCEVLYGWQYSPGSVASPAQPLAAALISGPSLLAAAAALEVSPVLGMDLSSWAGDGTAGSTAGTGTTISSSSSTNISGIRESAVWRSILSGSCGSEGGPRVACSVQAVADALARVLGVQAYHYACSANTTAAAVQAWLRSAIAAAVAATAAAGAQEAANRKQPASAAAAAAAGCHASLPSSGCSGCTVLCSVSGLGQLVESELSAVSQALMELRGQLTSSDSSSSSSGGGGGSIAGPLCVLCEVPGRHTNAHAAQPSTSAVAPPPSAAAAAQSQAVQQRNAVLGALQLSGRCIALQQPKASTVLELGFRHLGLTDAMPCARVLAVLMQQGAELVASAAAAAVDAQEGCGHASSCTGNILDSSISCVLQHLAGLQQQGTGCVQPGSSAWQALQIAVHDLLLPWVAAQGGCSASLLGSYHAAINAAQQTGCIGAATFLTQQYSEVPGTGTGLAAAAPVAAAAAVTGRESVHLQQQQQSAGKDVRCSGPLGWSTEQVAAAAEALCREWAQRALPEKQQKTRSSGGGCSTALKSHSGGDASSSSSTGDAGLRQPLCLLPEAAAQAAAAVLRALQLHGMCMLAGPSGVGKTLAWKLLGAAYQGLQQQQHPFGFLSQPQQQQQQQEYAAATQHGAVQWVHCHLSSLLDAAQAVAAPPGGVKQSLLQLVGSYYLAALQQQTALSRSSGAGDLQQQQQPAVLVLDVDDLCGPVQDLLLDLLQQHSTQAVSHTYSQESGGWGRLPWCMGCIVEVSSTAAAAAGFALMQQVPAVVIVAPGLIDHKQQLLAGLRAALRPLSVAVGCHTSQQSQSSDHDRTVGTGAQPASAVPAGMAAGAAACDAAGDAARNVEGNPSSTNSSSTGSSKGVTGSNGKAPGSCAATTVGSTVQLSVSPDTISSLAALLADLVSAGVEALGGCSSKPPSRSAATGLLPAAATAVGGAVQCQPDAGKGLRTHQLVGHITAMVGAMWGRATLRNSQLLSSGLAVPDSGSSGSTCTETTWAHAASASTATAEELATRLVVFACSWVLSGQRAQSNKQLPSLHSSLLAVLSGAGYAWAAPPGSVGLLGARPSLETGRWVSWQEDLQVLLLGPKSSSSSSRAPAGVTDNSSSAEGCGDTAARKAEEQLLQPYHVCSAGADGTGEFDSWELSPAAAAAAMHSTNSGCSTTGPVPGAVFVHSERTCALQCVLYWLLQAGISAVLLPRPGAGVGATVRHFLSHTWPHATSAAAAAAAQGSGSGSFSGDNGPVKATCTSKATGVASDSAYLALPAGLSAVQAASLLQSCNMGPLVPIGYIEGRRCGRAGQMETETVGLKCQQGHGGHSRPLLLYTEGWPAGQSSQWVGQLLRGAASTPLLLPLPAPTATGTGGEHACASSIASSGDQDISWISVPAAQWIVTVGIHEVCNSSAAAGEQQLLPKRLAGSWLVFNTGCLSRLPGMSSPAAAFSLSAAAAAHGGQHGGKASIGSCLTQASGPQPSQPLVQPQAVLQALCRQWAHVLPCVPHIPRQQQLSALQAVWSDLSSALSGLKEAGVVLGNCQSAGSEAETDACCFDLRHYKQTLLQLAVLCEQAAEQCAPGAARQQQIVQSLQGAFGSSGDVGVTEPQTPCTPGLWLGAVTPGSCKTPGSRLAGRKVPLKVVCLMAIEVLCRTVADRAATAEQQQALHRLVVLLVGQHLAALEHTSTGGGTSNSNQAGAADQGSNTSSNPVGPSNVQEQQAHAAADSTTSSSSSSTPRLPCLLSMLASAVGTDSIDPGATAASTAASSGASNRNVPTQQQQQQHKKLAALWKLLTELSEDQFSEAVRQECLPTALSGRYLTQLMSMAAYGQDPVQLGQPLHLEAARRELAQLPLQQHQTGSSGGRSALPGADVSLEAGAAGVRSEGIIWTPRRLALAAAAADAAGGHKSSGATASSSSSSTGGLAAADLAASARLLQCSSWVAAAHKLMWHLELATARASSCSTDVGPVRLLESGSTPAGSLGAVQQGPAVQTAVQSVALLTGSAVHCLVAAATTAAAATGCRLVKSSMADLQASQDGVLHVLPLHSHHPSTTPDTTGVAGWQQTQQQQQPVVLLVDLTQKGAPLQPATLSALQRCCSPIPWVCAPADGPPSAQPAPAPIQPVHLVLICALSQPAQLESILGPECYKLVLPGVPSRDSWEEDCRAQLMQEMGSALAEHLQDVSRCATQQQQQAAAAAVVAADTPTGQGEQHGLVHQHESALAAGQEAAADTTKAEQQQQQQREQTAAMAAGSMPAAQRLAERLSHVLAAAHMDTVAAVAQQCSAGVGGDAGQAQGLAKGQYHARHRPCSNTSSMIREGGSVQNPGIWPAHDLACEAVPLWKPADVLCTFQQLLPTLRQPLAARRSSLKAGIAGGMMAQGAGAATEALEGGVKTRPVPAGVVTATAAAGAAAGMQAPEALAAELGRLAHQWTGELAQVERDVAQLLPQVLLASLQLAYLGLLPTAVQQQLSKSWSVKLLQAVGLDAQTTAAAATGQHADLLDAAAGQQQQPLIATWTKLLQLDGNQHTLPASVLMQEAGLLPSTERAVAEGALSQQLQVAAAVMDVCCQPVLAVDPLGLLLDVVGVGTTDPGQVDTAGQAARSSSSTSGSSRLHGGSSVLGGADGKEWVVIQPSSLETGFGGASKCMPDPLAACSAGSTPATAAAAAAAAAALAAGRNVCLKLHTVTAAHTEVIADTVAAWHSAHLQRQATSSNSNSRALGGAQSGRSSLAASFKSVASLKASKSARAAKAAVAAGMPKLLVHVLGPCTALPVQLVGLLGVVSIGAEGSLAGAVAHGAAGCSQGAGSVAARQHTHAAPQQRIAEMRPRQQQHQQEQEAADSRAGSTASMPAQSDMSRVVQYVQRVLLPVLDKEGWHEVLTAVQAAEDAQQDAEATAALLMQHVAQEPASAATQQALLQSLARETQQLQQQHSKADAAAATAAAKQQAMQSYWQPLVDALGALLVGVSQLQQQQQQQQGHLQGLEQQPLQHLLTLLPVGVLQNLLQSAASAAVAQLLAIGRCNAGKAAAAAAATVTASRPHDSTATDTGAGAGAGLCGACPDATTSTVPIQAIRAAVHQMATHLTGLLPFLGTSSTNSMSSSSNSSDSSGNAGGFARVALNQPNGLLLQQMLGVLPVEVPIAVWGDTQAAALGAVLEAAAAMELPSRCLDVQHALLAGLSTATAAATVGLAAQHSIYTSSKSCTCGCWTVLLVDSTAAVPAVLAVQQQAQWRSTSTTSTTRHSGGCCMACGRPPVRSRLWLAVSGGVAASAPEALAGQCVKFAAQGTDTTAAAAAAAGTISLLLQAQGAELLSQQQQQGMPGLWLAEASKMAASSSSSSSGKSVSTYRDLLERQYSKGRGNSSSSTGCNLQACVLQPLMVAAAAAAAAAAVDIQQQGADPDHTYVERNVGGAPSDLCGMYDMLHCRQLLQRVAGHAVAPASETATAASGGKGGAVGGPEQSSSAAVAVAETAVQHSKLKHQHVLRLDLQQMQQLVLWAVLGPGCRNQQQVSAAAEALQESLSAEALGVRVQQGVHAGVHVMGGHIADVLEEAGNCRYKQQHEQQQDVGGAGCVQDLSVYSSLQGTVIGSLADDIVYGQLGRVDLRETSANAGDDNGGTEGQDMAQQQQQRTGSDGMDGTVALRRSSSSCGDDGEEGSGVLMPLGVCLGLGDLCAILQRRLG